MTEKEIIEAKNNIFQFWVNVVVSSLALVVSVIVLIVKLQIIIL